MLVRVTGTKIKQKILNSWILKFSDVKVVMREQWSSSFATKNISIIDTEKTK